MLVVDASVTIVAVNDPRGFEVLDDPDLVAPPLMWSEARSALHEMLWRRELDPADAAVLRQRVEGCPVRRVSRKDLGDETWAIADELGLAKTYDAEYLALARLLGCRMVTVDARLRRGGDRLGLVTSPTELGS